MPKKGTKSKPIPSSSPLPSEDPAVRSLRRPTRSAKTKAAAAWQPLATTRKRAQPDELVDTVADVPQPKRKKPFTAAEAQSNTTEPPELAATADIADRDTGIDKSQSQAFKSGTVPPRLRYRAPQIEEEGSEDVRCTGKSDASASQNAPGRHASHHHSNLDASVPGNTVVKHIESQTRKTAPKASHADDPEMPSDEDSSAEFHSNPSSDEEEEEEKDDMVLIELEGDAQALAHQFSQETPKWVEQKARSIASKQSSDTARQKAGKETHAAEVSTLGHKSTSPERLPSKASYSSTRAHELVKWKDEPEGRQHTSHGGKWATSPNLHGGDVSDSDDGYVPVKPEKGSHRPVPRDSIEIVWPEKGGKIGLKAQHKRVQTVAHRAIDGLLARVCLENAFPEGPEKHSRFARQALIESAEALGFDDIVERLKHDREYSKALATIPAQRLSTFRGRVKTITDTLVQTVYGLESGNRELVGWLKDSLRYIYPGDFKKDIVEAQKPFSPPIFVQVLRTAFFNNGRSIGTVLSERFSSTDPGRPDEKELPAPMLALVSTAIFASIADYEFDVYDAAEFSADAFADVYAENMRLLEHIKARGPKKYHALMHRLYSNIRGLSTESKIRPRISSSLAVLNLDDMEE